MKYITLEELERRKDILQEKLDKATEESKKNELTGNFETNIAQSHLFEVEYLIDYIKMKFDDKMERKPKRKDCPNCKHEKDCKIRADSNYMTMFADCCANFEKK